MSQKNNDTVSQKSNHIHNHHAHSSIKNIRIAFILNLFFTCLEIAGGLLTNSIAILSDAIHDLGDSVTLLFSLLMEKVSIKKGTRVLTYGYKRYSLLGAFFSAFVLITGSSFIIYNAINRIITVQEVYVPGMLLLAALGILFNGIAVLRLKKDKSLNAKVIFIHLLEDVLGWVSILIISIIMLFIDLPVLDPVLSIVIAVFILSRIIPNFMKIGRIFLQYKPDDIEVKEIKEKIEANKEVMEIHDIHLWSLDGINHIFSCHVRLVDNMDINNIMDILKRIKHQLTENGVSHSTLEFEIGEIDCTCCDDNF